MNGTSLCSPISDLRASVTAQDSNYAQLSSDLNGLDVRIRDISRDLELELTTAVELENAVRTRACALVLDTSVCM